MGLEKLDEVIDDFIDGLKSKGDSTTTIAFNIQKVTNGYILQVTKPSPVRYVHETLEDMLKTIGRLVGNTKAN